MASDPSYQTKIYEENGGDTLHIAAGGTIVIDPGAVIGAQPTIIDFATTATVTTSNHLLP